MSTVRDRIRAETTDEIKACARRQLATEGTNVSLRAVARELGMVSSAIYRYFSSRDDLLTALIVDGYSTLADLVVAAEGRVSRDRPADRFETVARTVRDWARANRAEYALLYGSPIPGYVAPPETVIPVVRLSAVLVDILADIAAGSGWTPSSSPLLGDELRDDIVVMLGDLGRASVPPDLLVRGFTAWAALFGVVSFEVFGHSVGVTRDYDALFEVQLAQLVGIIGSI
ncbi:MAG: TetR/AcrR family transcriptional regulator [Nakamurella sp.]